MEGDQAEYWDGGAGSMMAGAEMREGEKQARAREDARHDWGVLHSREYGATETFGVKLPTLNRSE